MNRTAYTHIRQQGSKGRVGWPSFLKLLVLCVV